MAVSRGNGWRLEWAQVEEDDYLGYGGQLEHELAEHNWRCLASLVKIDAEAARRAKGNTLEARRELKLTGIAGRNKMCCRKTVFGLGEPLLFFTKAPQ